MTWRQKNSAQSSDPQELLDDQAAMTDFIAEKQGSESDGWARLGGHKDATSLRDAIKDALLESQETRQSCHHLAEKIWDCLESKELAYVKTLQDQATTLDNLLNLLARQAQEFETLALEQSQNVKKAFKEVGQDQNLSQKAPVFHCMQCVHETTGLPEAWIGVLDLVAAFQLPP